MEKRDEIYTIIEKALLEISGKSLLPEKEVKNLAFLITAIASSSDETREYFYKEVYKVACEIEKQLDKQKKDLEERIKLLEDLDKKKTYN